MMVAPMPLRILLLEDVPADAALVERHLTKSGLEFVSQRVDTRARFEQALREFVPDIILSDHGLPGFDGSAALELVNERSEEHTSELQSRLHLVCRLLLEKKKKKTS